MRWRVKPKYCSNTSRTRLAAFSSGRQVTRPAGSRMSARHTASMPGNSARAAAPSRVGPAVSANAAAPAARPGSAAGMEAVRDAAWLATSVENRIRMARETVSRRYSSAKNSAPSRKDRDVVSAAAAGAESAGSISPPDQEPASAGMARKPAMCAGT